MAYSKSAYAKQLGISNSELEKRTRDAGFKHTEEYYNSKQGGSSSSGAPNLTGQIKDFTNNKLNVFRQFIKINYSLPL